MMIINSVGLTCWRSEVLSRKRGWNLGGGTAALASPLPRHLKFGSKGAMISSCPSSF
jgi:hypothetical protein